MKKFRWQLLIIFLAGIVVGILLLGEQPEGGPNVTTEPVQGGFYTEALVGSLQRLNPLFDFDNPADRDIDRLIYSRLISFDERGSPSADLATAWGISRDGTVYNFDLKPDVKWHDGEPLTADDVLFTVDLLRNGGSYVPVDLQEFWAGIEVVKLSPTALQFKLPEPFAPFLDYLSFGILPSHLLNGKAIDEIKDMDFNIQPVGSGPYQFDRLIVDNGQITGLVLKAFADYYGKQPFIEQLIFRYYPDSAAALQAYQAGQVQGISQISTDVLPAALAEPNLAVYTGRLPELAMVLFNLNNAEVSFFQDANLRRALYTGINRQYIVDKIFNGQAILADGPIFPGTWAYYDATPHVDLDVDRAKILLDEAGFPVNPENTAERVSSDAIALKFTLLYPDTPRHQQVAEAIAQDWTALGVSVTLEAVPYDVLVMERLTNREYQAALVDLNLARYPDPDPYPLWDSVLATSGQNYSQWDHKIASEYLEEARIAVDAGERARLYRNFQVIFSDELPSLPLYYPVYNYGVDRQVQGVRMGPLLDTSDRFATILEWFLVARVPTATPSVP
ncbi:MAG: ABC transporter substrate-binding protein [Bellilinea sp.]